MFSDISATFINHVVRSYRKYRQARSSERLGHNELVVCAVDCASALFHFREHIPTQFQKTRRETEADCPSYRLIADVTNCSKHRAIVKRTPGGPPLVSDAESIEEVLVCVAYRDEDGPYWSSELVISIRCTDGTTRSLDEAINETLEYWCKFLRMNGIGDFGPFERINPPGSSYLSRAEAKLKGPEATQELEVSVTLQFQEFRTDLGQAVPIRLDQFPQHLLEESWNLEFFGSLPDGQDTLVGTLQLSPEERAELESLTDKSKTFEIISNFVESGGQKIDKSITESGLGPGSHKLRIEGKPLFKMGPSFPLVVSKMHKSDLDGEVAADDK